MKQHIDELLARIETLQNELEEEYRQARDDWERKKQELADEFLRHQRRYKTGLLRFLLRSRLLVILSAPIPRVSPRAPRSTRRSEQSSADNEVGRTICLPTFRLQGRSITRAQGIWGPPTIHS